jgi:hypothetical protein
MLLTLHKLDLKAPLNRTGSSLVLAELVLPRNSIQRKTGLCTVALKEGTRSLARTPFYEKALLKEKVDGRFGLIVRVTRPIASTARSQRLRTLLATALESGADALSPFISQFLAPNPLTRGVLPDVFDEAAKGFADAIDDDAPAFIATGGIDLDSDKLQPGTLNIPLKLTETFRSAADLPLSERRAHRKSKATTYRKGSAIGAIQLQIEP